MDQEATLVTVPPVVGRKLIDRLKAADFPVSAAFWYRDEEAEEERLAIASPFVDQSGPRAAYERIAVVLQQHPEVASLSLLARISAVSTVRLRNWLVHGLGPFDRFRDSVHAPWIEGGSPAAWLAQSPEDRPKPVERS